jgi:hypothetical protein
MSSAVCSDTEMKGSELNKQARLSSKKKYHEPKKWANIQNLKRQKLRMAENLIEEVVERSLPLS